MDLFVLHQFVFVQFIRHAFSHPPRTLIKAESEPLKIKFANRVRRNLSRDGIRFTLVRKFSKLLGQDDAITRAKRKVLTKLLAVYGPVVGDGPFRGMKLSTDPWWGGFDLISKILGNYEPHIVEHILALAKKGESTFVDIGAADGYFPIGLTMDGTFQKAYAFEISPEARAKMSTSIENNGCSEKIVVGEEANAKTLKKVVDECNNAVILIDIEGAEYDLLNNEVLNMLESSYIICELHPWLAVDGQRKQQDLIARANELFHVSFLQRKAYEPNKFAVLEEFSDDERLLACSEGRPQNMQWMVLEPRNPAPQEIRM